MEYEFPIKTEFGYGSEDYRYPFPIEASEGYARLYDEDIEYAVLDKYADRANEIYKLNFDEDYYSLYDEWLLSPKGRVLSTVSLYSLYEKEKEDGFTGDFLSFACASTTTKKLYEKIRDDFEDDVKLEEQLQHHGFLNLICNYLKWSNKHGYDY